MHNWVDHILENKHTYNIDINKLNLTIGSFGIVIINFLFII